MGTPLRQAEMFEGVPLGTARVSLARARFLVEQVENLGHEIDDYYESCAFVLNLARRMRAHAVARVVGWLADPRTLDRHGYDAMHGRAERVANRWLRRQEVGR